MKIKKFSRKGIETSINFHFKDNYLIKDDDFVIMISRKHKPSLVKIFVKNEDHNPNHIHKYEYRSVHQEHINNLTEGLLYIKTLFSVEDYVEIQKLIFMQI